ncbi:hypothetical protein SPI_05229 [Niveomyces insectorum RCEF 264]|uniref:Uncharacterized protein n=1 Tax=Niveomyces insectorum RCEF 264 TaxID=1081102 RepID=A0A167U3C9_9HYPO|nr:hypothetical protein SPI_05229 [Niveomyces insectorum RCEF 264]
MDKAGPTSEPSTPSTFSIPDTGSAILSTALTPHKPATSPIPPSKTADGPASGTGANTDATAAVAARWSEGTFGTTAKNRESTLSAGVGSSSLYSSGVGSDAGGGSRGGGAGSSTYSGKSAEATTAQAITSTTNDAVRLVTMPAQGGGTGRDDGLATSEGLIQNIGQVPTLPIVLSSGLDAQKRRGRRGGAEEAQSEEK